MSISASLLEDVRQHEEVEEKRKKGFFGIGIYFPSKEVNCSTLFRSAHAFGADFIFTIGRKYEPSSADTSKSYRHLPCYTYKNFIDFKDHVPMGCRVVGVENTNRTHKLENFVHPLQCIYLLGSEGGGLPLSILQQCNAVVEIPSSLCLNVSVAGSIVLYDRVSKQ